MLFDKYCAIKFIIEVHQTKVMSKKYCPEQIFELYLQEYNINTSLIFDLAKESGELEKYCILLKKPFDEKIESKSQNLSEIAEVEKFLLSCYRKLGISFE
jgi:hypothetical protein